MAKEGPVINHPILRPKDPVEPTSDPSTIIEAKTVDWYNSLISGYNIGESNPDTYLLRPGLAVTHLLPAFGALLIADKVQQERNAGKEGVFTKFERKIIERWTEIELGKAKGETLGERFLDFGEFMIVERYLAEKIKEGLELVRSKILSNREVGFLENPLIKNIIASITAKEIVNYTHINAEYFEIFTALNATAVDDKFLFQTMRNTMETFHGAEPKPLPSLE